MTTEIHDDYDAVVVGARCAGAATAMLLARAGLRVALVDRSDAGNDTLSTHAFMRAGVIQLHRWGLLDDVIDAGTPAIRRTVFHYGDDAITVTMKPYGGVDAFYAPRRTVLDPILVAAARDAGVDVAYGLTAKYVTRDGSGRVTGIVATDAQGDTIRIGASVTVGADGVRSTIARRVQAPVEHIAPSASGFIYAHLDGIGTDAYEWYYRTGMTAGLIPTNDGMTVAWVGMPALHFRDEIDRGVAVAFHRLAAAAAPDLAARVGPASRPAFFRLYPGTAGFMRRPWGPGWVLVGDAGYYKDPITAHGMSDALRDADLVSRAIVDVVGGARSEAAAMSDYHQTRDRLSMPLFHMTNRIAAYGWDTATVGAELRVLSASMEAEVEYLLALDGAARMSA